MLKQVSTILYRESQVIGSSSVCSIFLVAVFAILVLSVSARSQHYPCLPNEVKAEDIVRVVRLPSTAPEGIVKKITIRESLKNLKAKCIKGKLLDDKRKEIRFFRIEGCWGNPPADYLEIQGRQRQELATLKRKYTVIEMSCSTGDRPRQSIQ